MVFVRVSQCPQERVGVGHWLIKKRLQHSCFTVDWAKCFKNTNFEEPLQVAVTQNNTIICF